MGKKVLNGYAVKDYYGQVWFFEHEPSEDTVKKLITSDGPWDNGSTLLVNCQEIASMIGGDVREVKKVKLEISVSPADESDKRDLTLPNSNITTPEQSKSLLRLGIPKDSADRIYKNLVVSSNAGAVLYCEDFLMPGKDYTETAKFWLEHGLNEVLPCWSAGQLVEIIRKCCVEDYLIDNIARGVFFDIRNGVVDLLVEFISENIDRLDMTRISNAN